MAKVSEYDLHAQVAEYLRRQYPAVLFHTDLSGVKLSIGQAVKVKRLQCGRAWPDIFLAEARRGYHGMALELKREAAEVYTKANELRQERHIQEQAQMLSALSERGYWAGFGCGFDEAKMHIDWYLSEEQTGRECVLAAGKPSHLMGDDYGYR